MFPPQLGEWSGGRTHRDSRGPALAVFTRVAMCPASLSSPPCSLFFHRHWVESLEVPHRSVFGHSEKTLNVVIHPLAVTFLLWLSIKQIKKFGSRTGLNTVDGWKV